jgi:hypothetical protein
MKRDVKDNYAGGRGSEDIQQMRKSLFIERT